MNKVFTWIMNHKKSAIVGFLLVLLLVSVGLYGTTQKKSSPQSVAEKQDSNPINGWLPVQTPRYKITYFYSPPTEQYYYQITLFAIINRPSEYSSYVAQLRAYKQEALTYFRSKGADPDKLHIQYEPPLAAKL